MNYFTFMDENSFTLVKGGRQVKKRKAERSPQLNSPPGASSASPSNSLNIIKWNEELRNKNTNQAMSLFYEQLTQAYNKSFPFMRKSRKG